MAGAVEVLPDLSPAADDVRDGDLLPKVSDLDFREDAATTQVGGCDVWNGDAHPSLAFDPAQHLRAPKIFSQLLCGPYHFLLTHAVLEQREHVLSRQVREQREKCSQQITRLTLVEPLMDY